MKNYHLLKKIRKSNAVDLFFLILSICFTRLFSVLNVLFLKIRGYKVDLSVNIGSGVAFFETAAGSIVIGAGSRIGSGARIKAGFDGKIVIGDGVFIEDYTYISAHENITIGNETMIAANVYIVDFNHVIPLSKSKKYLLSKNGYTSKPVKIGKYVWIGASAVVLPGVEIGDNAVIGAGSVVVKSIPANSVAVGVPAKVIKRIAP